MGLGALFAEDVRNLILKAYYPLNEQMKLQKFPDSN